MGFRFRKSIKIFPGLRLNLSKGGVSANVGIRGANISLGKRGAAVNLGVPGTGVGYQKRIDIGENPNSQSSTGTAPHRGNSLLPVILLFVAVVVVIVIVLGLK
jgi:hypothetical protein